MVPLRQFATFTEEQEFPLVWRRDRVPTLTVRADVGAGVLPDAVVGALAPKVAEFAAKLPRPYKVATGGLYEESAMSSASVFAVVPLMILLMLATMMLLLVSFRRLAMVVALLPLGLIGVVVTLLVFNRPLGFVAILGILALIGMIAKNAVILIVQIETDRAEGKSVRDAVMASATSRLRPMMLTAISTVLGLIPIAPTVFWGPMAFAIMGGLLVATLLTLILLPVLYVDGVRQREDARRPRRRPRRRDGRAPCRDPRNATRIPRAAAQRRRRGRRGDRRARTAGRGTAAALQRDGSGAVPRARPRSERGGVHRRTGRARRRRRPAARPGRPPRPRGGAGRTGGHAARRGRTSTSGSAREATRRELRQLFRVGRISLVIGLVFLAVAIVLGDRREPGGQGRATAGSSRRAS